MIIKDSEMMPPWEKYPTYERYTIGWRMGAGEDFIYNWWDFIGKIPDDYQLRLSYLKRHRAAPPSWGSAVLNVLGPKRKGEQRYTCSPAELLKLLELGIVEHDAAYQTWLNKQSEIVWPWQFSKWGAPEVARHNTRLFGFFSRQLNDVRKLGRVDFSELVLAPSWFCVKEELKTGSLGEIDPTKGLLTLAKMLCVGSVQPPWKLGLSPSDCSGSYEMDMGFTDAFRLWSNCTFDSDTLLREVLEESTIPEKWKNWVQKELYFESSH